MEQKKTTRKNVYWDKPETSKHTFDSELSDEQKDERARILLVSSGWDIRSAASYLNMTYSKVQRIHSNLMKTDKKYRESVEYKRYF